MYALSNTAVTLDMQFYVCQTDIIDEVTAARVIRISTPYPEGQYGNVISYVTPEAAALFAIYRDAINSSSPFYQFLCFYKIIERIDRRRGEVSAAARAAGQSPSHPPLKVPDTYDEVLAWLPAFSMAGFPWTMDLARAAILPKCMGKSVKYIRDTHLTEIRDNIAHALLDSGVVTFSIDDPENLESVERWLPSLKTLTRFALSVDYPQNQSVSLRGDPIVIPKHRLPPAEEND
jgi:hypothetical protein